MNGTTLDEYAQKLFGGEDVLLNEMRREAEEKGIPAIQVPPDLGRLLRLLMVQTQAKSVLEIGTLFGYSSILMARAMPVDGRLVTLEVNPMHADVAQQNLERAGVAEKVWIMRGPAAETLESLRGQIFDLVFIDADKDSYPRYLELSLHLVRSGSIIVADNVWRNGAVLAPQDSTAEGAARFNELLARDTRLQSTMIATRGGADAASVSIVL
jgi:predicted O-methyltransferase YrrM